MMYSARLILFAVLAVILIESTLGQYEECAGDPNAYIGCAGRCHRTCSDYQLADKPYLCPHACFPACDCKTGFVYDANTQMCVTPTDCSPNQPSSTS